MPNYLPRCHGVRARSIRVLGMVLAGPAACFVASSLVNNLVVGSPSITPLSTRMWAPFPTACVPTCRKSSALHIADLLYGTIAARAASLHKVRLQESRTMPRVFCPKCPSGECGRQSLEGPLGAL